MRLQISDALLIEKEKTMPEMMRFGMNMELPGEYSKISCYGSGPFENYWDRNTASFVGFIPALLKNNTSLIFDLKKMAIKLMFAG